MKRNVFARWESDFKKRLQHRCFPVNIAKLLSTTFFKEHLRWLPLYFMAECALFSSEYGIMYESSKLLTKGVFKFTLRAFLTFLALIFSSNKYTLPANISLITRWGAWSKGWSILPRWFKNGHRLTFCNPIFRDIYLEFFPKQISLAT